MRAGRDWGMSLLATFSAGAPDLVGRVRLFVGVV